MSVLRFYWRLGAVFLAGLVIGLAGSTSVSATPSNYRIFGNCSEPPYSIAKEYVSDEGNLLDYCLNAGRGELHVMNPHSGLYIALKDDPPALSYTTTGGLYEKWLTREYNDDKTDNVFLLAPGASAVFDVSRSNVELKPAQALFASHMAALSGSLPLDSLSEAAMEEVTTQLVAKYSSGDIAKELHLANSLGARTKHLEGVLDWMYSDSKITKHITPSMVKDAALRLTGVQVISRLNQLNLAVAAVGSGAQTIRAEKLPLLYAPIELEKKIYKTKSGTLYVLDDGDLIAIPRDTDSLSCLYSKGYTYIGRMDYNYASSAAYYMGRSISPLSSEYLELEDGISQSVPDSHKCTKIRSESLVSVDGASYYVLPGGWYQSVRYQGDYQCHKSNGAQVVTITSRAHLDANFKRKSGNASCFDRADYKNTVVDIAGSSESYYIDTSYRPIHIGSSSTYNCLLERGGHREVREVEYGYLKENMTFASGNASCHSRSSLKYDVIVQKGTSSYWYVDGSGVRRRAADSSAHLYCLRKRYGTVTNVDSRDIVKLKYSSKKQTCSEVNKYKSRIIRTPNGKSYWITKYGNRYHIPNSEGYYCQNRKQSNKGHTNVSYTTASRLRYKGTLKCKNIKIRNKIIRRANGTAYWIDGSGRRFHIPDGATFNCLGGWGKTHNHASYYTQQSYTYYGKARCFRGKLLNGRVIKHQAGDAHLISWSGNRHWIPTGAVYYKHSWRGVIGVSRATINALPEKGWAS